MIVSIAGNICHVYREPGGPKYRRNNSRLSWSPPGDYAADSRLLYNAQKILNTRGYDLLKKRVHKDGHLFGFDATQYLRGRDLKKPPSVYLYNDHEAQVVPSERYNVLGKAEFAVVYGAGRDGDETFERECRAWSQRVESSYPCYEVSWMGVATVDGDRDEHRFYRAFTRREDAERFLDGVPGGRRALVDIQAEEYFSVLGLY